MKKFLLVAMLLVAGCAGTKAAYKEADSVYETAYVVTEHYSYVLEQANALQTQLSDEQRAKLREVRDRVNPLVLRLPDLAAAWQAARTAENQEALEAALAQATVALAEFSRTLKEVR